MNKKENQRVALTKRLLHEDHGIRKYLEKNFDTESAELAVTYIGYG